VETRIAKLDRGEFGAIVLANAGLKRLGLSDRITHSLDIVSAVGQGAVGVECRNDDNDVCKMVSALNHDFTARAVNLEREFLKKVQGSCQTPLGCHVTEDPSDVNRFIMRCFLSKPDGTDYFEKTVGGLWRDGFAIVDGIFSPT
jgi:hydroxymethylbilane synthase